MNKKKGGKNIKFTIILLIIFFVIFIGIIIIKADLTNRGYKITNGGYITNLSDNSTPNKIDEGTCKVVISNTCTKEVFVPTRTAPEYDAFLANHPDCITLGNCPACGPSIYSCDTGTALNQTSYTACAIGGCGTDEEGTEYSWDCKNGESLVSCSANGSCRPEPSCTM